MSNPYGGQPLYGWHLTEMMRRINALEASALRVVETWSGSVDASHLAIDATNGYLYLLDNIGDKVYQVSLLDGSAIANWTIVGSAVGIAVGQDGDVYVADGIQRDSGFPEGGSIWRYQNDGTFVTSWNVFPSIGPTDALAQWMRPVGLVATASYLYVPITCGYVEGGGGGPVHIYDRVERHTFGGSLSTWWGSDDDDATTAQTGGKFTTIGDIAVTGSYVYAIDRGGTYNNIDRVQRFTLSGVHSLSWGTEGADDGMFTNATTISVDADGLVYVGDNTAAFRWQRFEAGGTHIATLRGVDLDPPRNAPTIKRGAWHDGRFYLPATLTGLEVEIWGRTQTDWLAYREDFAIDMGTPDGGVSEPGVNELTDAELAADIVLEHIVDMREAIEALAPWFLQWFIDEPYNWDPDNGLNLISFAMSTRVDYGATGGVAYDWTRDAAALVGEQPADIDIGEIYRCVDVLERSEHF